VSGRRLLVLVFLLCLPLVTPRLRGADEIEYFAYLPSLAFDGDLEFGNEYRRFYEQDPQGLALFAGTFLELREPRTGAHINFAPAGSALLWSPFYLLAHLGVLAARTLGAVVAADGLSQPYVSAACYASALYGLLGLLLVHDALRRFGGISDPVATSSVLALWLATPALYYMTLAPGFSHATSLFTIGLVVWLALRLGGRTQAGLAEWFAAGASVGLAALVREQDGLFGVVPAGVLLLHAWRGHPLRESLARALALGAAALLTFAPQLVAYRAINGGFGPSRLVARKMSWSSPHLLEVLVDPGHGLFVWSPLLLLAAVGLFAALARRRDPLLALLALGLLLQVWINGAVESWTQAGAFGSRRFVAATPVFAFGLAFVVAAARARLGRRGTAAVLGLFVWWNVSLMVQFGLRLMDRQRLEWPRVAVNQLTEVPPRLARTAWLFFSDRERLLRETR
jgi:hypothetical protein